MPVGLGIGFGFRRGRSSRPSGAVGAPAAGFEWVVGDVVTISGTCDAVGSATIADVVPKIRGAAIAEATTIPGDGTWTVSHTVVEADEYAVALVTALITDSEGRTFETLPVTGIIYPVDGDAYTYFYDPASGEFLVDESDGSFVIEV